MSNLVEQHQYSIPNEDEQRRKSALSMMWTGGLVFGLFLLVTVLFLIFSGWQIGMWAVLGVDLVALAICVYAFYSYWKRSSFEYEIDQVSFNFLSDKYYVPQDLMREFIHTEVYEKFQVHTDKDVKDLLVSVTVNVRDTKPTHRLIPEPKVGMTWPDFHTQPSRFTKIYGPHVLNPGGLGHELRLQACGILFPGRSEGEDIAWMKEVGII